MRKVLGAGRGNLIRQFLTESLLLNIVALILSMTTFILLLPVFDRFTGRDSATGTALTGIYWLLFGAVFLAGTLLSGLYPAFVLSGFQPVTVLKGAFKNTAGGLSLRKSLIVLQFITSVVLIAGTIIVYQQVSFMRNQKLGFNMDQTLVLEGAASLQDSVYRNVFQPFKNEVSAISGVKNITASSIVMGKEIYWTNGVRRLTGGTNQSSVTLYHIGVDEQFVPAYNLELIAGRNFSRDFGTDRRSVMLNQKAMEQLGFRDAKEAVGSYLSRGRTDTSTIIGVLADYHQQGLQRAIEPNIFLYRPNIRSYYSVKVSAANAQQSIISIQTIWRKHFPADPFKYFFLDDTFNQQYKADMLFGKVFGVFAFLAILIACFGLLGLSAYNVLQRTKEIGIRKVLGASAQSILLLLSKDFMKLILLALALAIPIAWYVMNMWLQDFAYRINIAWWVFGAAGIIALLIALLTIGLQALRAVTDNPAKSLRTE
jgi:putative ABC transport system permease protein